MNLFQTYSLGHETHPTCRLVGCVLSVETNDELQRPTHRRRQRTRVNGSGNMCVTTNNKNRLKINYNRDSVKLLSCTHLVFEWK